MQRKYYRRRHLQVARTGFYLCPPRFHDFLRLLRVSLFQQAASCSLFILFFHYHHLLGPSIFPESARPETAGQACYDPQYAVTSRNMSSTLQMPASLSCQSRYISLSFTLQLQAIDLHFRSIYGHYHCRGSAARAR